MITALLIIQTVVLAVFVCQSIRQRGKSREVSLNLDSLSCEDIDIIIASRESYDVISSCLDNVLGTCLHNIILCLDGCNDDMSNRLKVRFPNVRILCNAKPLGKIKSQIRCLKLSRRQRVLILDADIKLIPEKIPGFIAYFNASKVDFLCPYSIGASPNKKSFLFCIAETDRYMRQRVVRAGRDAYGVSNLSGYCMLADRQKYLEIIDTDAVQDDVVATINLLQKGFTVKTYHHVVCSEIERTAFFPYLLQKTRWTAGNIMLIASYPKLFRVADFRKALAFSSSFLLWYWALWVDFVAMILCFFYPIVVIPLAVEYAIKYIGLVAASRPSLRLGYNFAYLFVWPVFSTLCLILTPYYLTGKINERKTRR